MKSDKHWEKIGKYPHHGICVPLSALRTKTSCGIGEFTDLTLLIDFCKKNHLDSLQLLPLNDTGTDTSPYNPLSSCALDPIYISLFDLGLDRTEDFHSLTYSQHILRNEVLAKKMEILKELFDQTFTTLKTTDAYKAFLEKHAWVESYATFKALKVKFEGKNWTDWPENYPPLHRTEVDFHIFLQFHSFSQMKKVHSYANSAGVFIKGDIPILISPDSADVWAEPSFFRTDVGVGAPPDYYSPIGQHWGFPLFNWDVMRHSGFTWWKRRMLVAEELFDIYRIDHVIGFFRIWAIPKGALPTDGFFVPEDESLWEPLGREILNLFLETSTMLPIAEDLGLVPPVVPPVLKDLGICGTKVIRWEREWDEDRTFIPYEKYEPFSMTTVSTHDTEPLSLWWEKHPDIAAKFATFQHWTYEPTFSLEKRMELLHSAHHTPSYFHINLLQEYLALFPELIWGSSEDERINRPGTTLPTNWTYRFRPFLEELLTHEGLEKALQKILMG